MVVIYSSLDEDASREVSLQYFNECDLANRVGHMCICVARNVTKIVVTKVELELLMHEWCQHVSVTPGLLNKVSLHGCRVDMVSFMVH